MMKIGFKNFRKFKDFPMIELGGCTFLVGPNNSGKSTLLKAIYLLEKNRRKAKHGNVVDPILWDFSFAPLKGQTEHLYLGDFLSNLNDNAQKKEVTFAFQSGNTDFLFVIDGSSLDENETSIRVPFKKFTAYNNTLDIRYEWDFLNKYMGDVKYTYNPKTIINWINNEYWQKLTRGTSILIPNSNANNVPSQEIKLSPDNIDALKKEKDAYITELEAIEEHQTNIEKFYSRDCNVSFAEHAKRHKLLTEFLRKAWREIYKEFSYTTHLEYIETHNASHKVLLNPEDKNDYLAQTILHYNEIDVRLKEDAYKFVTHWMNEFKIGVNFIIKPIYNEAYIVDIEDFDGKTKSIGYLGTGSIQLFILLLRIAMAISSDEKVTIYIEEPEQNLHPALQSRLAEMFYEVWKKTEGRVEFVVETHSEYLVRHTQIIAAKSIDNGEYTTEELNDIFKVYYFPEEGLPYSMEYRQNGYFEKPFGTGFYDASGNLARELYIIDRGL